MSSYNWPATGSGGGGITVYPNVAAFPSTGNTVGQQAVDSSNIGNIYEWDGAAWILTASSSGVGAGITGLTGDGTAAGPGNVPLTLATVNGTPGSFGSASAVPSVTVNGKGLVTASADTPIQIAESQVTNLVSDLASKQATGNYITALTGDATASGPGSAPITLATVNGAPGTTGSASSVSTITTNGKGLVTSNSSTSIQITESQVTNLVSDLALKAPLASPTFTGTVTAPTFSGALSGNATTATTAGTISGTITESQVTNLVSDLALKAPLASPTFTGTVTAPQFASSVATGTAPLSVASTTVVPNLNASLLNGRTNDSSVAADTISMWDGFSNLSANNHNNQLTTTATAGGTTTMTLFSKHYQMWTGTTTQTVKLPSTSVVAGVSYEIFNTSTGIVTVQSSGANTIQAMPTGSKLTVTALITSPATASDWNAIMTVNGLIVGTTPTITKYTSGASNYTTPTGVQYIRVRISGPGGGGAGSGSTTTGGNGGNGSAATTFGSNLTAGAGSGGGGSNGGQGGAGGTASLGTGPIGTAVTGGSGGSGTTTAVNVAPPGGNGGSNPLGGAGAGGSNFSGGTNPGTAGAANTGAGGGAGGAGGFSINTGGGGGAGGYIEAIIIPTPGQIFAYSVGTGGSAGTAGTSGAAGGAGASGYIEIIEYYPNTAVSSTLVGVVPTVSKAIGPTTTIGTGGFSQTGIYTTPAGVNYIRVRMVGGGGGGGAGGTAGGGTATAGGQTFFGTTTANGGGAGPNQGGTKGLGGSAGSVGTGTGIALAGGSGNNSITSSGAAMYMSGGNGGVSYFGGAGAATGNEVGTAAQPNTGSGGGGGGTGSVSSGAGGAGGGSGSYTEVIIVPTAGQTFSYSVGNGGTGATLGTNGYAGGNGGSGYIEVIEYYTNLAVGTQAAIPANQFMAGPTSGSAAQPNFRAMVASDRPLSVVSKTTTYTMLSTDDLILASGSAFTVTLGAASATPGKQITIKKTDSSLTNIITVARAGSDTIDGATSVTLNTQYEYFTLVSDGTSSWAVVAHSYPQVWTSQTMTITGSGGNPTKGTNTEHFYTRRVGDSLELSYNYYQTVAGSAGTGTYLFALPSALTMDTSIYNAVGDMNVTNVGDATALNNGINVPMQGRVYVYDSTHLAVAAGASGTAIQTVASTFNSFSNATVTITFNAKVKISGWTG